MSISLKFKNICNLLSHKLLCGVRPAFNDAHSHKKSGDKHLSVWAISCVTDCRITDWIDVCTIVDMLIGTKITQDKHS